MTRAALLTQKSTSQSPRTDQASVGSATPVTNVSGLSATLRRESSSLSSDSHNVGDGMMTHAGGHGLPLGNQDESLASEDNVFDELKTTRSSSWQFELRQMERQNRLLSEELQGLLSRKKKRKRRKGLGQLEKDCANCHTRVTPEWRRGPSGQRDLCNSCGLRWAKQQGRVSPRKTQVTVTEDQLRPLKSHQLTEVMPKLVPPRLPRPACTFLAPSTGRLCPHKDYSRRKRTIRCGEGLCRRKLTKPKNLLDRTCFRLDRHPHSLFTSKTYTRGCFNRTFTSGTCTNRGYEVSLYR